MTLDELKEQSDRVAAAKSAADDIARYREVVDNIANSNVAMEVEQPGFGFMRLNLPAEVEAQVREVVLAWYRRLLANAEGVLERM